MSIKELPEKERPRERLITYGVENLSNEELLAIIIKTGTKKYSAKEIALNIIKKVNNITELKDLGIKSLSKIEGIGTIKAIDILASLELGKRVYYIKDIPTISLNNSKVVYESFKSLFDYENQEYFYAIYLDTKSKLISYKLLFKGTINTSVVHPREVFKYAILESASSIIVMHNHPTGDPTPSIQDKELTSTLKEIGKLFQIPLVDHIIFGKNKYYSFYEKHLE